MDIIEYLCVWYDHVGFIQVARVTCRHGNMHI